MTSDFRVIDRAEDLGSIANEILDADAVGLDIETTSFDPREGKIRLLQLNTGRGIYIIDHFKTGTLSSVVEALGTSKCVKVIQNAKFEQKWFLHHYNIELWPIFDTYRACALIYNGKKLGHNLYDIAERELGIEEHPEDLGGSNWSGTLIPEQYEYAAWDVRWLLKLRQMLKPKLQSDGLNRVALIEFQAVLPEASIELTGFHLNKDRWLKLFEQNRWKSSQLKEVLLRELPHPKGQNSLPGMTGGFNLGSTQQLQKSLARIGLNVTSTSEETLAMEAAKFPLVRKLIEWKKTNKLCTSFGPDYLLHINPRTGRVHASFFPFTGAGRYSCSDPNLQQIPRLKAFRDCFDAEEDNELVISDYSQIELRLAAEISGDRTLMEVYRVNGDAHTKTASIINEVAMDAVTKDMRQKAKPINFGLIYGLGAKRLVVYALASYGVVMSEAEAKGFISRYFQGYAGIKDWHERAISQGKRTLITRTLSGRKRFMEEDVHGEILNTPVQGSGADGLKASLPILYQRLKKYGGCAKMVHMVHDEIIIEAKKDPELLALVQRDEEESMVEGMQQFMPRVPVVVEGSHGASWADKA